jgi:hypothetical protein
MEVSGFYDDRTGLIKVKIAVNLFGESWDYHVKTKKEPGNSRFLFIPDLLLAPFRLLITYSRNCVGRTGR